MIRRRIAISRCGACAERFKRLAFAFRCGDAPSISTAGRMIARLVRTGQAEPVAFYCGRTKHQVVQVRPRHCNAYRPPQAFGQRTPMQAYHENFSQSAPAA